MKKILSGKYNSFSTNKFFYVSFCKQSIPLRNILQLTCWNSYRLGYLRIEDSAIVIVFQIIRIQNIAWRDGQNSIK